MKGGIRSRWYECAKCSCIALLTGTLLLICGTPLRAQSQSSSSSSQATAATADGGNSLPEAPQPQSGQAAQQPTQTPTGAAGAPGVSPKGSPGAQPAGAAVAPAKQRGHRSLLIKVGLIAGGAIAVGTVVALSEKSPTRPPGTAAANRP
jgi:hypothetical protein